MTVTTATAKRKNLLQLDRSQVRSDILNQKVIIFFPYHRIHVYYPYCLQFGDTDSGRWSLNCPSPDP